MQHDHLKTVFLFTGQGSQYRGMGEKLFQSNEAFRSSLEKSNAIVRKQLGACLIHELYYVKHPAFDDLLITHPAIVAIEIAMYRLMQSMNILPDYVAGISLGEFAAAVTAGVWNEEDAVEAAIEQAKSIVQSCTNGGMTAVINGSRELVEQLRFQYHLFLASDNFEGHSTVSGTIDDLAAFEAALRRSDVQYLRLPVQYAFHSPLIAEAATGFSYYMSCARPLQPASPGFISATECTTIDRLPGAYFWDAVSSYTNFPALCSYLEELGPCIYLDLGPSGTAATFFKYNLNAWSRSKTFQILTPYKKEDEQLIILRRLLAV